MPFTTTRDGTALFYTDWGSGPPVVFAASAWLNSQMWEYQLPYVVERGLRGIAYDRRGHGRSDQPWDGYDLDTLADDLAALLDHLDLRDVTLVGHSVGGAEVVRYLTRHGTGRVRAIALVAATTPFPMRTDDNPDGVPPEVSDAMSAARAVDRPQWNAAMTPSFFARQIPGNDVSPELAAWFQSLVMQCSPRANQAVYDAGFRTDLRTEMRSIRVPALVVHGDCDAQAPVELCGRRSARLIAGSALREYAGAGHGLFVTHAERLNADLLAFVREPVRAGCPSTG